MPSALDEIVIDSSTGRVQPAPATVKNASSIGIKSISKKLNVGGTLP